LTEECVRWVSGVLKITIPDKDLLGIAQCFRDGIVFCQLMNAFFPNTILTIHTANPRAFQCLENLKAFLT